MPCGEDQAHLLLQAQDAVALGGWDAHAHALPQALLEAGHRVLTVIVSNLLSACPDFVCCA